MENTAYLLLKLQKQTAQPDNGAVVLTYYNSNYYCYYYCYYCYYYYY
jgi:hypothetical protein